MSLHRTIPLRLAAGLCFVFAHAHAGEAPLSRPLLAGQARRPVLKNASAADADGAIVLTLDGKDSVATFAFDRIPTRPGAAWRVRVEMNALTPADKTQLLILVREHVKGRVVKPYHKNYYRSRALPARPGPCCKELIFRVGKDADRLSGLLVFSGGPARVEVRRAALIDDAAWAAGREREAKALFRAQIARLKRQAAGRKPLTKRTLVFSRAQVKYGLERNYYRAWIDRPLFTDRALRQPKRYVTPFASFRRVVAIGQRYGIDGFAFFPETKGRMGVFDMIARIRPKNFYVLPEFLGTPDIDAKAAALQAALKCPYAARLDGKLLITSYGAEALTPKQWRTILAALRKRCGDCFLFLPSLPQPVRFRPNYDRGLPFSEAEMREVKQQLRAYLDVCDGLYFHYPAAFKDYAHRRKFDDGFYRDLFIPVFKSVLAKPKYRSKLLGLSAYHSHYNADISLGLQEDNTRTLRRSFETALAARPEVIILPEWDEQNENTSFRPTVYNGLSTMRILRYYMRRLKGLPLSPLDGDDPAAPNLIVTYRKVLTVGEPLEIELLNVPDSTCRGAYAAQVKLLDAAGKLVKTFPPATFAGDQLRDVTLTLPTETAASCRALIPEIRITGYRGKDLAFRGGLHYIRLRAAFNWDYKCVSHPLRDLLRPRRADFRLTCQNGEAVVSGEFACDTPLAYAEVLEDDDVVYALDPTNEFMQNTPGVRRFFVEYRCIRYLPGKLTIRLSRPAVKWFTSGPILHRQPDKTRVGRDAVAISTTFSPHVRWALFVMNEADCRDAAVTFDAGAGAATVRTADILARGPWARTFPNGLCVTISERRKPLDLPPHLNTRRVRFTARVIPDNRASVFHVRMIAKNGRLWRSPPLPLPLRGADRETTTLRAYSDTRGEPVDVTIVKGRIPAFHYEFAPRRGDILYAPEWPRFSGACGGTPDALTLRGGNLGHSATMFGGSFGKRTLPSGPISFAPKWAVVDGRPCLRFDGKGAFVSFPRETIPRRGSFVIEFDIKPEAVPRSRARQYVFLHRLIRPASLSVFLQQGLLRADYYMEDHRWAYNAGLPIPQGKWSRVRITRDFEKLVVEVNGKRRAAACDAPGFDIGPIAFGGYGKAPAGWFRGCLASLRITHNSAAPAR